MTIDMKTTMRIGLELSQSRTQMRMLAGEMINAAFAVKAMIDAHQKKMAEGTLVIPPKELIERTPFKNLATQMDRCLKEYHSLLVEIDKLSDQTDLH